MALIKSFFIMSLLMLLIILCQLQPAVSMALQGPAASNVVHIDLANPPKRLGEQLKLLDSSKNPAYDVIRPHVLNQLDGGWWRTLCDVPYRYANHEFATSCLNQFNVFAPQNLWITIGFKRCKQICCEGDDENGGAEVLVCNDRNSDYSAFGKLFGIIITWIIQECDWNHKNPEGKARGQIFVSNNGVEKFNVILKDVSPGTICARGMYEPCPGKVGSDPHIKCPGGD